MLKLKFERSNGKFINIGTYNTLDECQDAIKKDIEIRSKNKFISPYMIFSYKGDTLENSDFIRIDVGSHTEFYHIERIGS